MLTADGFFIAKAGTSPTGKTRMQLALRVGKTTTEFGTDAGTCFTGATSTLPNREATCSTTRVVNFTSPTVVEVIAFGYADDQGAADSGVFNVKSFVTAIATK